MSKIKEIYTNLQDCVLSYYEHGKQALKGTLVDRICANGIPAVGDKASGWGEAARLTYHKSPYSTGSVGQHMSNKEYLLIGYFLTFSHMILTM